MMRDGDATAATITLLLDAEVGLWTADEETVSMNRP